jgi:hypothetical protein
VLKTLFITSLFLQCGFSQAFDPLPAADLSKLKPSDFTDSEVDLPFYLAHFREFAGSVVESGPDRGFIGISVWRPLDGNKPFNARIMENILSLAYFYTTDRPWNIYYGSKPVRQRLEAALEFWCRIQSPDGKFSEYGPEQWNLAATAFSTKFMGRALILLEKGPPIDPAILKRAQQADRKAIEITLTDADLWKHGRTYSNQYANVWAGGLESLKIFPDQNLEQSLWSRIDQGMTEFESPAGFFYEKDGPDFGYNSNTSQHNLEVAYALTRGTSHAKVFVDHDRRWFDWLAYNAVPAVDGPGWVLNRANETRQKHAFFAELTTPLAAEIPVARAYAVNSAEHEAAIREQRAELEHNWPNVPPLKVGDFWAWSPYAFVHRDQFTWFPSPEEQADARSKLPYNARTRFVHQRMDSRFPTVFTYVRRPLYYAAFNSGRHLTDQQRYGLGLVWSPTAGALLQEQTDSKTDPAGDVNATFSLNDKPVASSPGFRDLPDGDLTIRYEGKEIRFLDDRIEVTASKSETIPLLAADKSEIQLSPDGARMKGLAILYPRTVVASLKQTTTEVGKKRVILLHLESPNELHYSLTFKN